MKKYFLIIILASSFVCSQNIIAQEPVSVFGFYQVLLQKVEGKLKIYGDVPTPVGTTVPMTFREDNNDFLNPAIQQLNLFLRKEFTNNLTGFVNLQLVNNFSINNSWGYFNLEEAWVNYQYSDQLNVRGGILIPRFNYMNEIKNKTPLLPYITRPLVYESILSGTLDQSHYLPERAFFQVNGNIPVNKFVFDYAAFIGPAENDYIATGRGPGIINAGMDTTNIKLFGGRLGLKYSDLRLGASFTYDKDNRQVDLKEDVKRTRLGFDFGYRLNDFYFEGEYIGVNLDSKNTSTDMNKAFYYGLISYDISDQFYTFATYSSFIDKEISYFSEGMVGYVLGGGFKPSYNVVIKLEYVNFFVPGDPKVFVPQVPIPGYQADLDLDFKGLQFAVSVIF